MRLKNILPLILFTLLTVITKAQCPQSINFQAIVRDASNNPLPNTPFSIRFTITDSTNPGTPVYRETISATSNIFGLYTEHIGWGIPDLGTFPSINWGTGSKYIQIEQAINSNNYVNIGTKPLASHPYALYADKAAKGGYPKHYIGEHYGGGIVFYVTDNGQHGLIADSGDLQSLTWGQVNNTLVNAKLQGMGAGSANTERVIVAQGTGNYAAQVCANDSTGGYGDWFLPSASELALLFNQQQIVGGFNTSSVYWSSTENTFITASAIDFSNGNTTDASKSDFNRVRAVRAF